MGRWDRQERWLVQQVHDTLQIALEIVHRETEQAEFKVLPRRWVVERAFAWLGRYRPLSKDDEHLNECREGIIYVASICTMLKRMVHATSSYHFNLFSNRLSGQTNALLQPQRGASGALSAGCAC